MISEYLTYILKPLLSHPDKLTITENGHMVTIDVDQEDVGRVIGKKGTIIHHLRILVKAYCAANQLPSVTIVLNTPPKAQP